MRVDQQGPASVNSRVASIRTWDVIGITALVIVSTTSTLVWVWHPSGTNAPTEWLGVATGALALVTTVLATATVFTVRQSTRTTAIAEEDLRQSRQLVDASNAQVDAVRKQSALAEQALSESRRPVLIPCVDKTIVNPLQVSFFYDGGQRSREVQDFPVILSFSDENSDWVIVKIRNVGGGPAIVGSETGDLTLEREGFDVNQGFITSRVIAPGDEVPLSFRLSKETQPSRFWVSITYRDISYERRYRGRIAFDQKRPRPLLFEATVEDLNVEPD